MFGPSGVSIGHMDRVECARTDLEAGALARQAPGPRPRGPLGASPTAGVLVHELASWLVPKNSFTAQTTADVDQRLGRDGSTLGRHALGTTRSIRERPTRHAGSGSSRPPSGSAVANWSGRRSVRRVPSAMCRQVEHVSGRGRTRGGEDALARDRALELRCGTFGDPLDLGAELRSCL